MKQQIEIKCRCEKAKNGTNRSITIIDSSTILSSSCLAVISSGLFFLLLIICYSYMVNSFSIDFLKKEWFIIFTIIGILSPLPLFTGKDMDIWGGGGWGNTIIIKKVFGFGCKFHFLWFLKIYLRKKILSKDLSHDHRQYYVIQLCSQSRKENVLNVVFQQKHNERISIMLLGVFLLVNQSIPALPHVRRRYS